MKLSTKGRYGLRAMIDLASSDSEEAVSISSIAARQSISESYLEQLVGKLKKAGLVSSIRGAQGGYVLAKKMDDISVGDILRALEGDLSPIDCPALVGEGGCEQSGSCASKYVWQRLNDGINEIVDEIKLSTLVEQENGICSPSRRAADYH
ncbi:MAG: Rrf2 family transcriptional regulator [Christensenella sp.]|uniref:RrF2 family transcriptional regulator n=1 Tax=Christensenella sp. TaxID=1935934 RepID=UPI002B2053A5|nr:Rrf2 family transcriptional regulator [Christensenella sp.]MEA5003740.1 Rrf2 family transcriptional regulator [Christensenella sp.]